MGLAEEDEERLDAFYPLKEILWDNSIFRLKAQQEETKIETRKEAFSSRGNEATRKQKLLNNLEKLLTEDDFRKESKEEFLEITQAIYEVAAVAGPGTIAFGQQFFPRLAVR